MRYAFVVGGFYVSENSEHGFIPTIVLVPRADSPDSDVFSKVSQQTCYLHTLSSCDFEGVYSEKGFLQNRLPQEWVKGKNAAVINVTAIPNDDFVKKGFQVYSVNPDAVRQRTGLDERRFIQKLQLRYSEKALDQIQFIDGKTAQEIVNHSHDPSPLAKLCQAGILKLENLRPEYDGVPGARPPVLLRMMGAKTYECFRQTRPLSALQP